MLRVFYPFHENLGFFSGEPHHGKAYKLPPLTRFLEMQAFLSQLENFLLRSIILIGSENFSYVLVCFFSDIFGTVQKVLLRLKLVPKPKNLRHSQSFPNFFAKLIFFSLENRPKLCSATYIQKI